LTLSCCDENGKHSCSQGFSCRGSQGDFEAFVFKESVFDCLNIANGFGYSFASSVLVFDQFSYYSHFMLGF